jgi:hypothetical protein
MIKIEEWVCIGYEKIFRTGEKNGGTCILKW